MNRLQKEYQQKVRDQLMKEFELDSPMALPKIQKVILNTGITDVQGNAKNEALENMKKQFATITGQTAQITKAKKAISNFNLRQGEPIGVMVTLRGDRMWQFLDKLISIALPRVKDFRGVSKKAFDGNGNFSLGLEEQIIFPEIDYDEIESVRSLQVNIVTSADNDKIARRLLELLGMPFEKEE
jgi:large subunit ribosomal protein L5